jgi:hypothetical protein
LSLQVNSHKLYLKKDKSYKISKNIIMHVYNFLKSYLTLSSKKKKVFWLVVIKGKGFGLAIISQDAM